ncbi:hypothetical protein KORDIASMS9_03737 [Kordia sp. SMS9]|uniref:hypothetical protein n=1 Tax=Kordia sp. SMS9 TaxID=2282170 RepID=UPI000E0D8B02|nr:hypothetical protein [Kordia sp. SMS9]AXG71480.1 hypothetical protein KORDIASMS9_03737 [Kordia sp. SMS9]
MKKKKISGLSLRKRTVSSLKASSVSGGTDTNYGCFTYAPPCMSFTEPPEDLTFICVPPPTGTNPPNQTLTCNQSCIPQDCNGTGPGPSGPGTTVTQ